MVVVTFLSRENNLWVVSVRKWVLKIKLNLSLSQLVTKRKPQKISCELSYNPKCDYNTKSPFPCGSLAKYVLTTTLFNVQAPFVIA